MAAPSLVATQFPSSPSRVRPIGRPSASTLSLLAALIATFSLVALRQVASEPVLLVLFGSALIFSAGMLSQGAPREGTSDEARAVEGD